MVMEFFRRRSGDDGLALVENQVARMLTECRHSFDAAMSALMAGSDVEVVGPDVWETDRGINELERQIRRELVVHATVQGTSDVPAVLVYMSVIKDIERVGDYAKNILDLAKEDVSLVDADDRSDLIELRDEVSSRIADAVKIFGERDIEAAHDFALRGGEMQKNFDDRLSTLITSSDPAYVAVPRALLFRYLKRITAHTGNVVTAVIQPVDSLDYYDELGGPDPA